MSSLPASHKVVQLRLAKEEIPTCFGEVYFTGALYPSELSVTPQNAHNQLGYGPCDTVARLQAPSISINLSEEILFLSIKRDDLSKIIIIYSDFFREAKYIAMDFGLASYFILQVLPNKSCWEQKTPDRWKLFDRLEKLFVLCETGVGGCGGVVTFEMVDPVEADLKFAVVGCLKEFGQRYHNLEVILVRPVYSSELCTHLSNIEQCKYTADSQ